MMGLRNQPRGVCWPLQSLPNGTRLRRRGIGELLDETFRRYRSDFSFLFIASACVLVPYLILSAIFSYHSTADAQAFLTQLEKAASSTQLAKTLPTANGGSYVELTLIGLLGALIVTPMLYGAISYRVIRRALQDETVGVQEAVSHAFHRLGAGFLTLLLTYLLVALFAIAEIAVVGLLGGLLGAVSGGAGQVASVLVFSIGGIAAVVLLIWLVVRISFVTPVVFTEDLSFIRAIRRAFSLSRRNVWRIIGYIILVYLIEGVLQLGLSLLLFLVNRNPVVTLVLRDLLTVLVTPFLLLALSYLYLDVRIRTDALDMPDWTK